LLKNPEYIKFTVKEPHTTKFKTTTHIFAVTLTKNAVDHNYQCNMKYMIRGFRVQGSGFRV